jgi:hypothetical protein
VSAALEKEGPNPDDEEADPPADIGDLIVFAEEGADSQFLDIDVLEID